MFKFLRKYNKWILAIGGSLLMITFVAPQLVQQFGGATRGSFVVATYDGGKITLNQLQQAQAELQIAGRLTPAFVQMLAIESPEHWLLLGRLAERSGLLGSAEDGRDLLSLYASATAQGFFGVEPEVARELAMSQIEQVRSQLIREMGFTADQIDLSMARLRSIERLNGSIGGTALGLGIGISDAEFRTIGRHMFDQAQVDIALFNAEAPLVADLPAPDEARLQEVFERFQSERAEANQFGIGYYRQPAVALEWITINRGMIATRLQLDPIELRKFYLNNRAAFPGEFADEQPRVEQAYRDQQVNRIMDAAVRAVRSELLRASRALPSDGRFRTLPQDWSRVRPSMQSLADLARSVISAEPGLTAMTIVEAGKTAEMVEPDRLTTLGTISSATYPMGSQSISFRDLVLQVRELNPDTHVPLQRGLTFGPIQDASGNRSFFTVVEVRAEGPAPILDVVRDRVTSDARRLAAYESVSSEAQANALRSLLIERGLDGIKPLAARMYNGVLVSRSGLWSPEGPSMLGPLNVKEFCDAVLDHVRDWSPAVSASDLPMEQRVLIVPIPRSMSVAAVVVNQHYPTTRERVRQADGSVSFAARAELVQDVTQEPLSFAALSRMLNFKSAAPANRAGDDEE